MPRTRAGLAIAAVGGLIAATLYATPAMAAPPGDPVHDPIPEQPIQSGLGLTVKEYASFPKSETYPTPTDDQRLNRWARINYLGDVPDGSGRKYVPDLNGMLYLVKNGTPHPYLDVGGAAKPAFYSRMGLGQGFGFAAFDPEFERNGRFYTVHTEDAALATRQPDLTPQTGTVFHGVITEWTAADPSADTFSGTHREVLRLGFGGRIHGIQQIDFNPNARPGDRDYGLLYVAAGDGGTGRTNTDPQNLAIPQGKLLRIDPRRRDSANGRYGVPKGNPFYGQAGRLGEIYAYGFRDPHRFSWDRGGDHRLYLGHIGEHAIEAVYDIKPGTNAGWSEREGRFVFDKNPANPCDRLYPLPADDAKFGYTYPVAAYDHDPPPGWNCTTDVGVAISGGFVYRGDRLPGLNGKYVFGDIVDGRVLYTDERTMRQGKGRAPISQLMLYDEAGKRVAMRDLSAPGSLGDPARVDLRFSTDGKGDLYLIAKANGKIWKVTGTKRFAACEPRGTTVGDAMAAPNWAPVTPSKWRFPGDEVILAEAGVERPGPRRPFEYAVLTKGPAFGAVRINGQVRLDTPVEVSNRDVIVVFGYRSDTEFYYAHLSSDNTILPHNGIFRVNNADRVRLDDQWDAVRSRGAPPAISDAAYHKVGVTHCASTGEIAVHVDGSKTPLMTAVDTTFASGRVGFGSFDNVGRLRDLVVRGVAR